jgi:hypothetical protein
MASKKKVPNTPAVPDTDSLEIRVNTSRSLARFVASLTNLLSIYPDAARLLVRSLFAVDPRPESEAETNHRHVLEIKAEEAKHSQALARSEIDSAIAKRILTAESVEIEEHFDASGKGFAGFNADEHSLRVGASGEAQRVVKRKIILNGKPQNLEGDISGAAGGE